MTDTVTIREQNNYGRVTYYPSCDLTRLFTNIAGRTTLTEHALREIEDYGLKIEIEQPTAKTWR
jgi:hypothetical protein